MAAEPAIDNELDIGRLCGVCVAARHPLSISQCVHAGSPLINGGYTCFRIPAMVLIDPREHVDRLRGGKEVFLWRSWIRRFGLQTELRLGNDVDEPRDIIFNFPEQEHRMLIVLFQSNSV